MFAILILYYVISRSLFSLNKIIAAPIRLFYTSVNDKSINTVDSHYIKSQRRQEKVRDIEFY
jgi:hypothetical protein